MDPRIIQTRSVTFLRYNSNNRTMLGKSKELLKALLRRSPQLQRQRHTYYVIVGVTASRERLEQSARYVNIPHLPFPASVSHLSSSARRHAVEHLRPSTRSNLHLRVSRLFQVFSFSPGLASGTHTARYACWCVLYTVYTLQGSRISLRASQIFPDLSMQFRVG